MAGTRPQQSLFQENSTTIVTPLAAEMRERLQWSYPDAPQDVTVDEVEEALSEIDPELRSQVRYVQPSGEESARSLPPGVRADYRGLQVVPGTLPGPPPAPPPPSVPGVARNRRSDSAVRVEAGGPKARGELPTQPEQALPLPSTTSLPVAPRGRYSDSGIRSSAPPPASFVTDAGGPREAVQPPQEAPPKASGAQAQTRAQEEPQIGGQSRLLFLVLLGVALISIGGNILALQRLGRVSADAAGQHGSESVTVKGAVAVPMIAPQPGPSCLRESSQTIPSSERDQLLLDAVRAVEKGRHEQALELFRRYVDEACDSATLAALSLLSAQPGGAAKEGSK